MTLKAIVVCASFLLSLPSIAAPVITSQPPTSVNVGAPYSYTIVAVDDEDGLGGGPPFEFAAPISPAWLQLSGNTISGTPGTQHVGANPVMLTVQRRGEFGMQEFTINVIEVPNSPPALSAEIGPDPQNAVEGQSYSFDIASFFSDADNDPLTFTAAGLPGGLTMNPNGTVSGTPAAGSSAGSPFTVTVSASDGQGPPVSDAFTLNIASGNRPPALVRPIEPDPQNATEGAGFDFNAAEFFSDPDGDELSFTASGLPSGLAMSAGGAISGTLGAGTAAGSPFTVTVVAADDAGESASDSFVIIVAAGNRPPILDGQIEPDPQNATEGENYRFDAGTFFSDPDGDNLTFTATGLPPSLGIAADSGVISGTLGDADAASGSSTEYAIRVSASDGVESASDAFTLNVTATNEPPSLPNSGLSFTTQEDTPLQLTPAMLEAVDENPNDLTVVLTPPDADSDFTVSGGGTTVRPAQNFHGTLTVEARVRDAEATSNPVSVTVTVAPVNDAPSIDTVPPQNATEGGSFSLDLTQYVSDIENDALTYRADDLPPGLSVDAVTGIISGTPPVGVEAGDYEVRLTVNDGSVNASTRFGISVLLAGRADLEAMASVAENPVLVGAAAIWTLSLRNNSSVDVANVLLEAVFSGDTPFQLDPVADTSCTLQARGNEMDLACRWSPLAGGTSMAVEVSGSASQAGEIFVTATASIEDAVPLDETPENDTASVVLNITERLSAGPSQQLDAPGAQSVAVGDFNADALDDLAVATGAGEQTLIFLNGPDPADANKVALTNTAIRAGEASTATDIASGDLDGNGSMDLVVTHSDSAATVLINDGQAGFTSTVLESSSGASNAVAIADVDGDALPDLVYANTGRNAVYMNRGAAQFVLEHEFGPELSVDVIAADLLDDALPELVFANSDGGATIYHRVDGAYVQAATLETGPATSVATNDFDGDGDLDLVFGRGGEAVATSSDLVFLNTSTGSAGFFLAAELARSPTADILTGDFNGDGSTDIIAINADGSHQLYTNSGAATTAFLLHPEQFAAQAALSAAVGTFSADARLDVAVAGADIVSIFFNDGLGNLGGGDSGAPTLTLIGEPTVTITVGDSYTDAGATASDDLDGDLTADIVVANPVDTNVIGTYTVTYDVVDGSGNAAATLSRTVEVQARSGTGGGGGGAMGTPLILLLMLAAMLRRPIARRV